jgi:hypothetical protein
MSYSEDITYDERDQMTMLLKTFFSAIAAMILFILTTPAPADVKSGRGDEKLMEIFRRIEPELQRNNFGLPLFLESSDRKNAVSVDVYGIIDHQFSHMRDALNIPANWCDIVSLPPNIRACTYQKPADQWTLTFYSGRQFEQSPEEADQVIYSYQTIEDRDGYLSIVLKADEGPLGTRDHRISFEAVPIAGGKTFVHFRYALKHGILFRIAGNLYFDTLGRDKVGFTVIGTDRNGDPVYAGGPRGGIERNAVRYYFAIESFMDTINYPEESRFREKVSRWYDRTTRYKQLEEKDKKEYLKMKERERKLQKMLQDEIPVSPE